MTILGSFLLYGIEYAVNGYPALMGTAFSTYYISLSIFLGFAISFPDMQVLLYFIIPIKIKWLAYLDVALLAYSMITSILSGNWAGCVVILCSLANVLVFFLMTRKGKHNSFRQNRRRKEFKKAVSRGEAEYRNPNVPSADGQVRRTRNLPSASAPNVPAIMNTARITCLRMNM